jgi:hypothetical protein
MAQPAHLVKAAHPSIQQQDWTNFIPLLLAHAAKNIR